MTEQEKIQLFKSSEFDFLKQLNIVIKFLIKLI